MNEPLRIKGQEVRPVDEIAKMRQPGLHYEGLEVADVIQYEGDPDHHIVTAIHSRPGREGRGGMDQGSPPTRSVRFDNGREVRWDPWRERGDYVPFKLVAVRMPPENQANPPVLDVAFRNNG